MNMNVLSKTALRGAIGAGALGVAALLPSFQAHAALLVGNTRGDNVVAYDEISGAFLGGFIGAGSGGLKNPDDLTFGPDGNLYVSSSASNSSGQILRYSASGAFLGVFAQSSSLRRPYGSAFGADGNLYVASFRSDEVLRYNGTTGAFIDVFAKGNGSAAGLLNGPNDLQFSADGKKLFVTTQGSVADSAGGISYQFDSQVLSYDVASGVGSVVATPSPAPGSAGYVSMLGLAFGPDGFLYTSDYAGGIRSYDSDSGALVQTIATGNLFGGSIATTIGNITFGPGGTLYAAVFNADSSGVVANGIAQCSTLTGVCSLLASDSTNLLRPIGITYVAGPIPEPSTLLLLAGGLGLVMLRVRRRAGYLER